MTTLAFLFALAPFQTAQANPGDEPITGEKYIELVGHGIAASWFKGGGIKKYRPTDTQNIAVRGLKNVRLRTNTEIFNNETELKKLDGVINDCLSVGLVPIISWINHTAESRGSAQDREDYVNWWAELARRYKGTSYLLGFNLFTEINDGTAIGTTEVYNDWTRRAVTAIRAIDPERMIVLAAPRKKADTLDRIDSSIYAGDDYMIAEWHLYASGPNKDGGQKNWEGEGKYGDRQNVTKIVNDALDFTRRSGLKTWVGAWMPMDNITAALDQDEVHNFGTFFLKSLNEAGIPSTVNALDHFYDKKTHSWHLTNTVGKNGASRTLNMETIMDTLVAANFFDSDNDGMDDYWERYYLDDLASPGFIDNDLDGLINLEEFIAGSNPADIASTFVASVSGGGSVSWNSQYGRSYSILWSESLTTPFTLIAEGIEFPQNSYTNTSETAGFFKVQVELK